MAQADRLCIVFRIGSLGVVMPVVDLMAIQDHEVRVDPCETEPGALCQVGIMAFRQIRIPVYSLARFLYMAESDLSPDSRYLVFAGAEHPWAIVVDQIDGVVDTGAFECRELPDYLLSDTGRYRSVAIRDGEPLVSLQAASLGAALAC